MYVNNLVGDVTANSRDFYRYINSKKKAKKKQNKKKKKKKKTNKQKTGKVFHPLKRGEEMELQN